MVPWLPNTFLIIALLLVMDFLQPSKYNLEQMSHQGCLQLLQIANLIFSIPYSTCLWLIEIVQSLPCYSALHHDKLCQKTAAQQLLERLLKFSSALLHFSPLLIESKIRQRFPVPIQGESLSKSSCANIVENTIYTYFVVSASKSIVLILTLPLPSILIAITTTLTGISENENPI